MPAARLTTTPASALTALIERVRSTTLAPDAGYGPCDVRADVVFLTSQSAQHTGRRTGYTNTVLSVRVGASVGSCAVEPGQIGDDLVRDVAGRSVDELLTHDLAAVRVAALDAYLLSRSPHEKDPRARRVRLAAGTSLAKSMARARAVGGLLDVPPGGRVAVIGVVNSLLVALRERRLGYHPCDIKGGTTEWGEPIATEHAPAITGADAVLATGMILGNGTFDEIVELCRDRDLPLVMFAQTGSAVLRELLGSHLSALSAEPYPFFWLTGDTSHVYTYAGPGGQE